MSDSQGKGQPHKANKFDKEQPKSKLLSAVLAKAKGQTERQQAVDDVEALVRDLVKNVKWGSKKVEQAIEARIQAIDEILSRQVSRVMHAQKYQQLEGSWRGLHMLVHGAETGTDLKIRVLNASKDQLRADQEDATEFDQSHLFKAVYEHEYGTFGGSPFAALVIDQHWGRSNDDVKLLRGLSGVAAAAHAPLITGASAELFDVNSFRDIDKPRDLAKIFERTDYAAWNSFRDSDDSRYVSLCMPRYLSRLPYGGDGGQQAKTFAFVERLNDNEGSRPEHGRFCWSNAAFAYALRMADAFAQHHWCVAIRGVQGGGLVTQLPTHTSENSSGEKTMSCPTESPITDRRKAELYKLGFNPLVHCKDKDYAAFFGGQSARRLKKWNTDEANANERLSAQIPYTMVAARFAHYLKAMCRDWIGSFGEVSDIQTRLNTWISEYVLINENAGQEMKAKFPLRAARIDVEGDPARPGHYRAVCFLRPHFQLEEIDVSLRMVASLPDPVKKS